MDQRKQIVRGLLDEFLTAIRQPDKTSIVPAPNRWFAKPEDFPHQQPMIERALAANNMTRSDFPHGAYLDPRTGQDLTGRMMQDVGAVIDPNTGRPVMSGRESGLESFAELEKKLGNQTLSNLVRRSKFKPLGGDPLLNDIPFITTVESGPHFYGLGMEYASPTQLFQIQRGDNPHLRPKSRGDVFGMGEVVGRMQIGKGPEHDVYEKLFVAPRGSDVPGKKLSKAEGGEVQMGSNKKMPNDEAAFKNWIRGTDWFKEFKAEYNEEPDLDTKDYDYRAAWKAGVQPERDPYDNNRFHWPSSLPTGEMLKSADHPTAWKEYFMRETGVNPDALGLKTPEDANIFIENISKGQEKAAGGEVHMADGGDPMLADLIERYNTPRNKSRYSAGIFDSNAPGEVRSVTPTVKERMASGLQAAMESAGSDRYKARQRAQTILGGPNSRLPGGFGVADIGAMVNPVVAAGMIPLYGEAAMHDLAGVPDAIKRGDYVGAGVDTAFGLADVIPAVGQGKRVAKGLAKGIKDAATSDAGYNLAQNVLKATGTAPAQIMMGENSKTWNHGNAALAKHMELQGADPLDIWQATGTFRGADGKLRQEIPDFAMEYNPKPARKRQTDKYEKSRDRSMAAATTPEEQQNVRDYYKKELQDIIYNVKGKTSEFIDHPELRAAYPELFDRPFKQLDPTNPEYTAAENTSGFFQPTTKTIVVNGDFPEHTKRDTVLHELQHAVQQLEGWQGGSSPALMAMHMADRDALKYAAEKENELLTLLAPKAKIRPLTEQSLKDIEGKLEKYKQLEGIDDPFKAYERAAGEEEARAVERRSRLSDEELKEWHPSENYDTPFSEHITDFATGGAVMMAGGKDVTKEAIKQGVKKGIDAVGNFLNSINPNDAIAREAARLQTVANPIKASEALSPYEGAYLKLVPYDRMKVDLSGKERGGPNFSGIQLVDPLYANAVSGVTDKKTATRLINKNQNVPEGASVIWTPSVGSPIQHRSNATMFNKFADEFDLAKSGIAPELIEEMNKAASTAVDKKKRLIFPQGMDFNAQNYRKIPQTYDQRRLVADIFSGKGVGGKRGQTVANYDQLILDNTDPLFVDVPNGSIGPRLFTLDNKFEIRPDLHSDYPFVLTGKDLGVTYTPIPREPVFTDFAEAVQAIKERPVTAMDFDRGDPTQLIHRELINRMRDEGHAEGGEVHMDKGGAAKDAVKAAVKDAAEALRGYIDPISNRISDWNWRPMSDVRQDVPLTEIPEYIQGGFGNFMAEQAKRAAEGNLNARDLIKAYTITRSSVNRGGLPYNTATKTGMKLPRTTEKLVRPEGAFAEWLGSKAGQRYLDDAVLGKFDEKDLEDMVTRFGPFGMPAVLADDMRYAARTLSPKGATISADVTAPADVYRDTSQQIRGIGPAKSGFMASLLGRGDFPTFDARQINLHTGEGGKQAKKYLARGYGEGGEEAVARLADRQRAMNMSIDPALAPFYQHLTHHTVWDALDNSQVTHNDLMKAMRGYADGGEVDSDGVTLDDFLSKQGY